MKNNPKSVPVVEFDRVSVSVQGRTLLSDVSFTLGAGEKAVIRGESGSGKSTLLRSFLGLHPLAGGVISFEGRRLGPATIREIRSHTAYIGQEPVLGADKVRDALLLPFRFNAHRASRPAGHRLVEVLRALRLPAEILDQECARVSGGEKQRIALARALLLGKSLYLLDEVTSALDPESRRSVFEVLADPGRTVLSVAHDPDWIDCCERVFDLREGRLTEENRRERH